MKNLEMSQQKKSKIKYDELFSWEKSCVSEYDSSKKIIISGNCYEENQSICFPVCIQIENYGEIITVCLNSSGVKRVIEKLLSTL